MKIGVQTWGSNGDIRPFLALAGGLSAAGHDVTLVVTSVDGKDYSAYAKPLNIRLVQTADNFDPDMAAEFERKLWRVNKRNVVKHLQIIMDAVFFPLVDEMYAASKQLCDGNELVIGHMAMYPLRIAAQKSDRPFATVSLNHSGISSAFQPPGGLPNLGKWANAKTWNAVHGFVDRYLAGRINALYTRENVAPVRHVLESWESGRLSLIAVSSVFCRAQPDWGNYRHVCGFLNLPDGAEGWSMPGDLREFIEARPPPVFITLGSMTAIESRPAESAKALMEAVRLSGARAIIQHRWDDIGNLKTGGDEITEAAAGPGIFRLESAPHQMIFPECAAVVHHGGAGTAMTAARSGCPSVVVQHFCDQLFWGSQLHRLGIAPKPLHMKTATPKKIAGAIRQALDSRDMKPRAEKIGREMKSEDGVGNAVKLIEAAL